MEMSGQLHASAILPPAWKFVGIKVQQNGTTMLLWVPVTTAWRILGIRKKSLYEMLHRDSDLDASGSE
jgi:hypothetical protein